MTHDPNELISELRQKRLARYDSGRVRQALYIAIARTQNRAFIATLCQRAVRGHSDYAYVVEALLEYGAEGAEALLKAVMSAIESGTRVRHYVTTRLCRMLPQFGVSYTPEIATLVRWCLASNSKRCRMAAISLVKHYHLVEFVDPLGDRVANVADSEELRVLLATLGEFGSPSSESVFAAIMDAELGKSVDEDDPFRNFVPRYHTSEVVFAFLYFAKRRVPSVIPLIQAFLGRRLANGEELMTISKALAEFARVDPELISTCLDSEDELLRGSAVWALGWAGTEAALDRCKQVLSVETSPYVAHCAAGAMAKAHAAQHVRFLKSLLRESSPWAAPKQTTARRSAIT